MLLQHYTLHGASCSYSALNHGGSCNCSVCTAVYVNSTTSLRDDDFHSVNFPGALYNINDTYESPFHFAACAMFFAAVTNTMAIIVTRFWPDTTRTVVRTVRGRGSEAVWVHASVLKAIQVLQLARRRKANVAELITWQDLHYREHSDVKEKLEHDAMATTPSIPPGSEKGYQDPDTAFPSNSTHAPVMITIEDVDIKS